MPVGTPILPFLAIRLAGTQRGYGENYRWDNAQGINTK
jgi:hypothetical protein